MTTQVMQHSVTLSKAQFMFSCCWTSGYYFVQGLVCKGYDVFGIISEIQNTSMEA